MFSTISASIPSSAASKTSSSRARSFSEPRFCGYNTSNLSFSMMSHSPIKKKQYAFPILYTIFARFSAANSILSYSFFGSASASVSIP